MHDLQLRLMALRRLVIFHLRNIVILSALVALFRCTVTGTLGRTTLLPSPHQPPVEVFREIENSSPFDVFRACPGTSHHRQRLFGKPQV